MAWAKVGGNTGPILKWETVNQGIEGIFLGLRKGKIFQGNQSKLVDIKTADGKQVTAGAPTALAGQLADVALGAKVRITYLGKARGQGGVEYKNFQTEVEVPEGQTAPTPPAALTGLAALHQKLREVKGVQVADLMYSALESKYPDVTAREAALAELLKAHGA